AGPSAGVNELRSPVSNPGVTVKAMEFVLVVSDEERKTPCAVVIGGIDPFTAVCLPIVVLGRPGQDAHFLKFHSPLIEVKKIIPFIISNINIQATIAIEIGNDHAQGLSFFQGTGVMQSGFSTYVRKGDVAIVFVDYMWQSVKLLRRHDVPSTIWAELGDRVIVHRPIQVVTNIEIGESITVKVGPGGARAPEFIRKASFLGHIDKMPPTFAIWLVVVKGKPAITGHQQIRPAVVIVVGDRAAVRVEQRLVETHLRGNILEFPSTQILKKPARMAFDFL